VPVIKVKSPVKLERAEIIKAENIIFKDRSARIPILEVDESILNELIEDNVNSIIGEDIGHCQEREAQVGKEIEARILRRQKPILIDEFTINNLDKPVEISSSRVPEDTVPISEVQEEVQHAYDKGFDDGQQITISTFKAELESHQQWVKNFDEIVKVLQKHYIEELKKFEDSLASLAVVVAEHILEREVDNDSSIVIEQTKKAIRSLDDDIIFKIHLNPHDVEVLKEVKSELLPDSSALSQVEITADNSVERGGCTTGTCKILG